MSGPPAWIVRQFRQPRGLVGKLAGMVMFRRPSNRLRNQAAVKALELGPEDRLIDFGCGPGYALGYAARQPLRLLIGIDHSALMVKAASKSVSRLRSTGAAFVTGGCDSLLALAPAASAIMMINVVQFLEDRSALFQGLHHQLPSAARLCLVFQPRGGGARDEDTTLMQAKLLKELDSAGFQTRSELLELSPAAVLIIARKGV